jgi:hypothetical protein
MIESSVVLIQMALTGILLKKLIPNLLFDVVSEIATNHVMQ